MKQNSGNKALVIGAGFAGLAAAITMARQGYAVTLLEKHDQPGGRARVLREQGFLFDMGPSWYWMPEVAAGFFARCGRRLEDYLTLTRLDPSYQVVFGPQETWDIPASFEQLQALFEQTETGAGDALRRFMEQAAYKYNTAMDSYINKPGISIREYMTGDIFRSCLKMDLLGSFRSHARRYFADKRLLQLIEFPVLFLGAMPDKIPAMYSMMNYADMKLGTWYPTGGMHQLVKAFTHLALELGVRIELNTPVKQFVIAKDHVTGALTDKGLFEADLVIAGADYHHIDQELLPAAHRNYSGAYWEKRQMAPSCLLYYVGVRKQLPRLRHHNLFFENDLAAHAATIYESRTWPEQPLFYCCCPSKTDASVAPAGMENLFILIPTAPGLADTPAVRNHYQRLVLRRLEAFCGSTFTEDILFIKSYAHNDFVKDYNAFKGNAYGLANTLSQTAFGKPSIRHRSLANLFFTGQLTVPGPGVPPAILSGELVANYITHKKTRRYENAL